MQHRLKIYKNKRIDKTLEMTSDVPTNVENALRQILHVRVASDTQNIQFSDWPK